MIRDNKFRADLVDVDASDVIWMFEQLTGKERDKVFRIQLKKSAVILANETTVLFKKKIRKEDRKVTITRKSGKKVTKWRRIATVKLNRKKFEAKVHIMADYKVKWFEMGTKPRRTKGHRNIGFYRVKKDGRRRYALRIGKPADRGQLRPGHFFREAQRTKEREIFRNIETDLSKAITLLAKKKRK